MKRLTWFGGLGGIAFAVLTFASLALAAAPGGNYSASDATSYVASGHRAAVFVSTLLAIIAAAGLICLFARLRDTVVEAGQSVPASIIWGAGLAVSIAFLLGDATILSVPITYAFSNGGGFSVSPAVIYAIVEVGDAFVLGAGGILMGLTLIALFAGARSALPIWLRWVTLIAGILGLASPVFFPFFALLIWGLATGIWLVAQAWRTDEITAPSTGTEAIESASAS